MHAWRTTALPPMISKRRIVRSPQQPFQQLRCRNLAAASLIFEVAPSRCLPPVDFCSGVKPSQSSKVSPRPERLGSRRERHDCRGGDRAHTWYRHQATRSRVFFRPSSDLDVQNRDVLVQRLQAANEDFEDDTCALGKLAGWVLDLGDQCRHMCGPFGNHPARYSRPVRTSAPATPECAPRQRGPLSCWHRKS